METGLPKFVNMWPPRFDDADECSRALRTGDYSKSYAPGTQQWKDARYEILLIKSPKYVRVEKETHSKN